MVTPKWKTFEDTVRGLGSFIFGEECQPGRIAGVNFDGVIEKDLETVVLEISRQNDLDKVRQGITRLTLARQTLALDGVLLRGFIILSKPPTQAMLEAARDAKVTVASASQFAGLFFRYPAYKNARLEASFGSSIDPITGSIDRVDYVPVKYQSVDGKSDVTVDEIRDLLLEGINVVLLGEYGSGKSRCVRELFNALSDVWDVTFQFPYAVNLRECWGLERGDEIIRRGAYVLGLDDLAPSAVRAFNKDSLIVLLDGFDEVGSQSWSTDEIRLRQLRAKALVGVKDLISRTTAGCLVAGRQHYFSSDDEMMSALGLSIKNTRVFKAKDEFTEEELEAYFDATGLLVELPSWLPRKPLICQTIALLSDDELGTMFGIRTEGVEFWNHFIRVVCRRDARINAIFDEGTIYQVFVALSRITRSRPANIGPISQRDLQDAFEVVVGQLPVEEASAMLQRLPSLGRIGAESQDRQFVDMFILDGLRAKDVAGLTDGTEAQRQRAYNEKWTNPLQKLGQSILGADLRERVELFVTIAAKASTARNGTLAADIVCAMSLLRENDIDLKGIKVVGADISEIDLNGSKISNLTISDTVIEHLVLPHSPPTGIVIEGSMANKVSGAASLSGLPSWVRLDVVDKFDSVQTVSQIRRAGFSPAHEILVAILKKTFQQKGSGRKEEALLRGFGGGASRKLAPSILTLLMREGILTRHTGDEGWVYKPERDQTARVTSILDQLRSSNDPLWKIVDDMNG